MTEIKKAIISNRIYYKPPDLKEVIKSLTYRIESKSGPRGRFKNIEIIKNYRMLPQDVVSIPQGRTDLIPEDYVIIDKRVLNPVPFPLPQLPLRPGQQTVYDEVNDSCFINALVGWGKSYTALHIARKLGQKTLVITHTAMLRDQWCDDVRLLYGMEPGIIGSGQFDIEDRAIVIGNVQTVTKMMPQLCKEFGTIILDEAHHVPANTFATIVDGMYSRYKIALSGTMLRTDGKHVIFRDYFGSRVYKPPQSHTLDPIVKIINTGIHLPPGEIWVKKINTLLYDDDYQQFIASMAKTQISKGHVVLIVASRVEFLTKVQEYIGEDCILITGETDYETRKALIAKVEAKEVMCVAGSRQIFSEGISINCLSCVILSEPTANPITLEQIIGRIMRLAENKLNPVVLDMNFSSAAERRQNTARLAFYASKGWKVEKL